MAKARIFAVMLLLVGLLLGYFTYSTQKSDGRFAFKLGLDLEGGSHLIYLAHTENLAAEDVAPSMESLRDVIERRVNLFGVSEPLVQIEKGKGEAGETQNRLIVELPGVTDINQAIALIGATPTLEFKLAQAVPAPGTTTVNQIVYESTGLTGRYLKKAILLFDQRTGAPQVSLEFNSEGTALFAKITKENVGKILGIFLDNAAISEPVISEEIPSGQAVISGNFTPTEGKILVGRLNAGALPVAIDLLATEKVGASLGERAVVKDVRAGVVGLVLVALFLLFWYRLPGFLAILALCLYIIFMLALFKLIPVTLTAAGIAGIILSIGMAVDANILIFERMKEELKKNESIEVAMHEGFARAWPSIRDSNISSMITAVVLFWLGTSLIKGFALTFGLGVIVSMFTAITATRWFLYSLGRKTFLSQSSGKIKFLFGSGLSK